MKHKKNFNPFFRMALLLSMLLLAGIVTAIGLFYYMFSIPEPEGMSLAYWPQTFTDNFSSWTTYEDGKLSIEQIGLNRLDEYGLWIQFLDGSGREIFSHNKPAGYPFEYSSSELLADSSDKEKQTIQEYGSIILTNINHTEKLINDLKLTYQLDSGSIPYNPQKVRITRCVKEWVIDIINNPAFSDRDIAFESHVPELYADMDSALFRRAVTNLVINALVHNPSDTKVSVMLDSDNRSGILLSIRDNGNGLSESEQERLFERYYRGTNTKEKPEGSGLGLAIANQIVTLHGGEITAKSQLGIGTEFVIHVPYENGETAN